MEGYMLAGLIQQKYTQNGWFYSTLAAFALVTWAFSTRLISTPFEQKTEIERGEVGED